MLIVPTEKRFDWQHAPVVLIAIVLLNVLVFLLYQSKDGEKAYAAMEPFIELGYIDKEWALYQAYLHKENRQEDLADVEYYRDEEDNWTVAQYMLMDADYFQYVKRNARNEFSFDEYDAWLTRRTDIQTTFDSMSANALGLKATDVSVTTLLTHQFLHGGVGHIFGNMIFLIVFGFAVEAAIGHLRFLVFYLIGGICAGMAQVVMNLGSDVPLVGASGAISGVMAMYLAVFRLKKIEFFYWAFFFVGYFRAPALLILPFYIGKELYSYYTMEDSNVAFMAHAGGFVGGSVLIGIALMWNRNILNDDYIEQDQSYSSRDKALADIYQAIEALRFDFASKQLAALIEKEGLDFQLAMLQYNLKKIHKDKPFMLAFRQLMTLKNLSPKELQQIHEQWLEEVHAFKMLTKDDQLNLAFQFTTLANLSGAEQILEHLFEQKHKPSQLLLLANKLATRFAQKHDHARSRKYQELAQRLTQEGHHGVM
ncbi:MAG: rhomboid family intramembrane serine protease [Reinekea sp.]|jgi:membrane associated rhomboid family serine protease|nr:rhomboid family intramembrane serine protease [Reinekea sp.]